MKITVFGLGLMGGPIAANLVRAGYEVDGFDPSNSAQSAARAAGVLLLAGPSEISPDTRVLISSLPTAEALHQCVAALPRHLPPGLVLIELSTLSIADKERARDVVYALGCTMLDAPLSGTGAQAVSADLSAYVSGDLKAWREVEAVVRAFASRPVHVGAFGAGMRMKLVANLLVAIHNVATAEAMALVLAAGIDPAVAVDVLRQGAGGSRIFELRAPLMAERRYEPPTMKLDVWSKDMELIVAFLHDSGVKAPTFEATRAIYSKALELTPKADTAAVFEVLSSIG
jgi:L-threonate 2-dehydrogenase